MAAAQNMLVKVLAGLGVASAGSMALVHAQQAYLVPWCGGSVPISTNNKAWEAAYFKRLLKADREAAEDDPIMLNPLRHSIPAEFRNGDKLVLMDVDPGENQQQHDDDGDAMAGSTDDTRGNGGAATAHAASSSKSGDSKGGSRPSAAAQADDGGGSRKQSGGSSENSGGNMEQYGNSSAGSADSGSADRTANSHADSSVRSDTSDNMNGNRSESNTNGEADGVSTTAQQGVGDDTRNADEQIDTKASNGGGTDPAAQGDTSKNGGDSSKGDESREGVD